MDNPFFCIYMINIVLFEPEIPSNTGNIARTCVLTNSPLHLIKPLGFSLDDKYLKRAGLDYWDLLDLHVYENFDEFLEKNNNPKLFLLSTKAEKSLGEIEIPDNSYLMFGKETAGLPDEIHDKYRDYRYRIPMRNHEKCRSLNLANSVNIALYEALRQHNYFDLK